MSSKSSIIDIWLGFKYASVISHDLYLRYSKSIYKCWTPYSKLLKNKITLVRKELGFCYEENLIYFTDYSFSLLLFTGVYNSLIIFFHCLEIAEKLHEDVKETKAIVKEIHHVVKRPDNRQSSSMATGDRIGRLYFSLLPLTTSIPHL